MTLFILAVAIVLTMATASWCTGILGQDVTVSRIAIAFILFVIGLLTLDD